MNRIFTQQSDHPLFRYFTRDERERVEDLAKVFTIEAGGFLIEQGEVDSTLFAVEDGHLEVVIERGNEEKTVASVGPGDVLGEVSFIDDSPRSVSVRAAEDTKVMAWNKKTLSDALGADPQLLSKFAVAMSELLVERLRDSVRRQGSFRPV
ncbi:MAG TPA: cyclic nucleotide-binding domain-containing protein [Thermoanaerobaculia bacterium]|nr:cyclic nucleotide-binding domain-containing protein [Thermoanaerobaculia bacterium]